MWFLIGSVMITHPFGLQPIFRYLVLYTVYNPKKKQKYNSIILIWFYGFGMVWIVLFFLGVAICYIVLWIFPCCRRNSEASLEFQKNIPHLICVSTTFSREVMFEKTLGFLLWFQVGTSTVGHGFGQGHPKRMVVYWKNLFFNRWFDIWG